LFTTTQSELAESIEKAAGLKGATEGVALGVAVGVGTEVTEGVAAGVAVAVAVGEAIPGAGLELVEIVGVGVAASAETPVTDKIVSIGIKTVSPAVKETKDFLNLEPIGCCIQQA